MSDRYETSFQLSEDAKHDPEKERLENEAKANAEVAAQEEDTKRQEDIVAKADKKGWRLPSPKRNTQTPWPPQGSLSLGTLRTFPSTR